MQRQVKRILSIGVILALIFSLFVVPASALEYVDYRQFASYDFSDDYANVTVRLPTEQCRWDTYTIHYNQYIGTFVGSYFYWDVTTDNYAIFVNPFGTSFNVNSTVGSSSQDGFAFRLADIPIDAQINCVIKIDFPNSSGLIHEDSSFRNFFVSDDVVVSRTDSSIVPSNTGTGFTYSFTMNRADYSGSADGWLFALSIPDFWVRTNGQVICSLEELSISFSLSALQYQAEQSGKTNALLEGVKAELAEQNKTLDDILGSLNQNSGGASGALKDQTSQQGDKLDQMAGVMDSVDRPDPGDINISMDQYISQDDFQTFSPFLQLLWDTPIFMKMLLMLLMVAAVSYVLFGKKG